MTEAQAQAANKLDRTAMIGVVDAYLAALGARDPSRLKLAPGVKFTENCQVIPLGAGLWATTTSQGRYRIYFADVGAQQIGSYAVVEEMGNLAILSLRLKLTDGRISEIEHLVGQEGSGPAGLSLFAPTALTKADPIFDAVVEPARRSSRAVLIKSADLYYDGIEQGKGSIVPALDDCVRIENGVHTALNPDRGGSTTYSVCESIEMGYWTYLKVRDRRYPIVDEERGLSWSLNFFESPGNVATMQLKGQGPTPLPPSRVQPSALPVHELFKVIDGKIVRIETVLGPRLPFGARSGWD